MSNKKEYKMEERILLNLSEKQQKDLSALWAILIEMKYGSLTGDEITKINPVWLEERIRLHSSFDIGQRFLEEGVTQQYGLFNLKKTKKRFCVRNFHYLENKRHQERLL